MIKKKCSDCGTDVTFYAVRCKACSGAKRSKSNIKKKKLFRCKMPECNKLYEKRASSIFCSEACRIKLRSKGYTKPTKKRDIDPYFLERGTISDLGATGTFS